MSNHRAPPPANIITGYSKFPHRPSDGSPGPRATTSFGDTLISGHLLLVRSVERLGDALKRTIDVLARREARDREELHAVGGGPVLRGARRHRVPLCWKRRAPREQSESEYISLELYQAGLGRRSLDIRTAAQGRARLQSKGEQDCSLRARYERSQTALRTPGSGGV
eukprot:366372-Chlamydomonas_euryale.AAC.7